MATDNDTPRAFMKYDDWINHWSDDDTPFHVTEPDEILVKKAHEIFGDKPNRVFVPCCGKVVDMMWMYNRGYTVVGAEIAERAVSDFFKEQKLEAKIVTIDNVGKLYKTEDDRIKIYAADIFNLTVDLTGTFDVIWDSAGLSVINKEDRPRYFSLMKSLMKPETGYFIIGADYDKSVWPGPPHPLNKIELTDMCGEMFNIEEFHMTNVRSEVGQGGGLDGDVSQPEEQSSNTQDEGKNHSDDSFSQIGRAIAKSSYFFYTYHKLTLKY